MINWLLALGVLILCMVGFIMGALLMLRTWAGAMEKEIAQFKKELREHRGVEQASRRRPKADS